MISELMSINDFKSLLQILSESCAQTGILDLSNKNINSLDLIKELTQWIKENNPIQIYLENCELDDEKIKYLSELIETSLSIQLLCLRFNKITDKSTDKICNMLRKNNTLKCIDLLRNNLVDIDPLITLFCQSSYLESVCGLWSHFRELVIRDEISTADAQMIAAEMKKNKNLAFLDANYSENLNAIGMSLVDNTVLNSLKLLGVNFSINFANTLATGLSNNSSLKTLSIAASNSSNIKRVGLAEAENNKALHVIIKSLEKNDGLTTLRLENFNFQIETYQALANLIKVNKNILYLGFFSCNMNISGLSIISKSLESNLCLRYLNLIGNDFKSDDLSPIETYILKRKLPLLISLSEGDYPIGDYKNNNEGGSNENEWQVDDIVEVRNKDGSFSEGRIVSLGANYTYHIVFTDGEENEHVLKKNIRKAEIFSRITSIFVNESRNIDDSSNKPRYNDSYKVDDSVQVQFYGDFSWYPARIIGVNENQSLFDVELEDDGSKENEIEIHMIRTIDSLDVDLKRRNQEKENSTALYSSGLYQRGDYCEVRINKDLWRRGRIALDNCDGTYEVRMEDGSDEHEIPGRYIRGLFKVNDNVDFKPPGYTEWYPGKITRNEKDGKYTIEYSEPGTTSKNIKKLNGVNSRSIMTSNKSDFRKLTIKNNLIKIDSNDDQEKEINFKSSKLAEKIDKEKINEDYDHEKSSIKQPVKPSSPLPSRNLNLDQSKYKSKEMESISISSDNIDEFKGYSKDKKDVEVTDSMPFSDTIKLTDSNTSVVILSSIDPGTFVEVSSILYSKTRYGYIINKFDNGTYSVQYNENEFETGLPSDRISKVVNQDKAYYNYDTNRIHTFFPGQNCQVRFEGGIQYMSAIILRESKIPNSYDVIYNDNSIETNVSYKNIRPLSQIYESAHSNFPDDSYSMRTARKQTLSSTFFVTYPAKISKFKWYPLIVSINTNTEAFEKLSSISNQRFNNCEISITNNSSDFDLCGDNFVHRCFLDARKVHQIPFFIRANTTAGKAVGNLHFFINSLLVSSVTYKLEITDDESNNYTPKIIESNINKSVFLFASEEMEMIEKYIMENRIVNLLDLKIYRIDKFDSITHSMIMNSDQIQFLCSYQDSLAINNEKIENSFPLSFIFSNNLNKNLVVCDKVAYKQTESLEASEENQKIQFSNGLTFCPDACVIEWINKDSVDSLKKNKILDCINSIRHLYFDLSMKDDKNSRFPMGFLYIPYQIIYKNKKLRDLVKISQPKEGTVRNSSTWFIFFFSDDCSLKNQSSISDVVEVSFDLEFLFNSLPFLKATLAVLLAIKLSTAYLPVPFNAYYFAENIEISMILALSAYYEDQITPKSNDISNVPIAVPVNAPTSPRSQSFRGSSTGGARPSAIVSPRRDSRTSYANNLRPAVVTTVNTSAGPSKNRIDESFSGCVRFIEEAFTTLLSSEVVSKLRQVSIRLDLLCPDWQELSLIVPITFGGKYWWLTQEQIKERWIYLLQDNTNIFQRDTSISFENKSNKFYKYPSQTDFSQSAEQEIFEGLAFNFGMQDKLLARRCAKKFVQEGCENWNDILNLPTIFGGDASNAYNTDQVYYFFTKAAGIPTIIATKLLSYIKKNHS